MTLSARKQGDYYAGKHRGRRLRDHSFQPVIVLAQVTGRPNLRSHPRRAALVRVGCVAQLSDVLHLVREVATRRWRRKSLSIQAVERNGFLYDLAKLLKDSLFVRTVAPAVKQTWRAADKALVFLRPLDDLCVSRSIFHDFDSSTARFTART